jgi:Fe-S-cluster-containing dehydrogenase component
MSKKLIIDLEKCKQCPSCQAACSYKYHPDNNGIDALLEKARFALICRKCELAPCIEACPQDALEKVPTGSGEDKILKRANMLCTGCGTCAAACPFGTVYTELIPYLDSVCDVCRGRLAPEEKPLCVTTCTLQALSYEDAQPGEDLVEVFEDVLVRVSGGLLWEPFLRNSSGQTLREKGQRAEK